MTLEKKENKIWGTFGKISTLIILLWTAIQIYNNVFKSTYSASVHGDHYSISYPQTILDDRKELNKYIYFLDHFPIEKNTIKNNRQLDSIINDFSESNLKLVNAKFYNEMNLYNTVTIWSFTIKNDGNSPLEDLNIELPFSGQYKLIDPDNKITSGNLSHRLKMGDLNPSFSYKLTVWKSGYIDDNYFDDLNEKDCKINHKFGTFDVSFPYRANGFIAWVMHLDLFLVFIFVTLTLLVFLLLFIKKAISSVSITPQGTQVSTNTDNKDMD